MQVPVDVIAFNQHLKVTFLGKFLTGAAISLGKYISY